MFFLFEKPLAKLAGKPAPDYDLLNNWIVVLAALLLTVGTAILIPRRSKDGAVTKGHLGNTTLYLDARELQEYNINDRLGRAVRSSREHSGGCHAHRLRRNRLQQLRHR